MTEMLNFNSLERLTVKHIDTHEFITDLMYFEGPLLSLFRDDNSDWLYLWCDTDTESKQRWLLFNVTRGNLVSYMEQKIPLLNLVQLASSKMLLDTRETFEDDYTDKKKIHRSLRKIDNLEFIQCYLPTANSFFNESLAPDISTDRQFKPELFDVPINGRWFVKDLERFNRLYAQLYSFFYCSQPQFITDLDKKVSYYLHAPWKGGFSRVHLFEALKRIIPSVHDLEIKQMRYASAGELKIEALPSVGGSISSSILRYIQNDASIELALKELQTLLSSSRLNTENLSTVNDDRLPLTSEQMQFLRVRNTEISLLLNIQDEILELTTNSPNMVVTSKVIIAVVSRIQKLAEFQLQGLLDLERQPVVQQ